MRMVYVTERAVSILMVRLLLGNWPRKDSLRIQNVVHLLFKRNMGTDVTYTLDKKEYDSGNTFFFILKQLIEDAQNYLHESIDEVVISVPAYFNARQKQSFGWYRF